jgi:GH25 family lysozyme M1 (1,4-beta-N-acetylmuramidase)
MKHVALFALIPFLSTILAAVPAPALEKRATTQGIDISVFQPTVDFNTVRASGVSFVYIKATEGTSAFIHTLLVHVIVNKLSRM